MDVCYLHGIAGHPRLSGALEAVRAAGHRVVAPYLPGFDAAGEDTPLDHLDWIVRTFDRLDAAGVLPCAVIGASAGGMLAAELAILRPEMVTGLALLSPLGIFDPDHPGEDLFAVTERDRPALLFAGEPPACFDEEFADRGPAEAAVARYLRWVAAAGLTWPLADRGVVRRCHRLTAAGPVLVVWGDRDRINPPPVSERWPAHERVTIPGAGHLLEWDQPVVVGEVLVSWLDRLQEQPSGDLSPGEPGP